VDADRFGRQDPPCITWVYSVQDAIGIVTIDFVYSSVMAPELRHVRYLLAVAEHLCVWADTVAPYLFGPVPLRDRSQVARQGGGYPRACTQRSMSSVKALLAALW
jgi:hypothetical protein